MNIGGELTSLIKTIDYSSKQELLDKLRNLRDEVKRYPKAEKSVIMPHLAVAIQQAFYTSEWELINFKKFLLQTNKKQWRKNGN